MINNKEHRYGRRKWHKGCRIGRCISGWHERELWILTCWKFETVTWTVSKCSKTSDCQELFTHYSTSAGWQQKHGEAKYTPKNWQKMPSKIYCLWKASQILCPDSLSLEMPANTAYTFWLWSLTLKFWNSWELGRIQQPVCQLTGTKDVASKLLSPIHIPGPRGNTNTLGAREFKLTLWHGLQNTWSYWQKRGERKMVFKRRMCYKRTETIHTAAAKSLWNNNITLAATIQKVGNNSYGNGSSYKITGVDVSNFSSRNQAPFESLGMAGHPLSAYIFLYFFK